MSRSTSIASVIPWSQVCRMLDKVQSAVRASKKEMLLKFISQFRELLKKKLEQNPNAPDSFFPVLRILLPALDRVRGAYGVKERKLAELYIRILGLKKEGNDAQKLIHFRKPKSTSGSESGDFAEVAYYVLKNRCPDKGDMTLHDVDTQLTSIAENYAAKKHEDVERSLLTMLRNMTATEQKWLIRVLLKDMRLGIGQGAIFNAWHPDAKDYYDVNNNLETVCKTLRDPKVRIHEIEVSLFSAFRPMLAERAVLEKVEAQMKHKPYFAETKFDGERSQVHKKGNAYKYFSRNGFDFTSNFGGDKDSGLFTPYLHPLFPRHVKEIILDGEMVGWSKTHNAIVSKGEHMDVKNLKEGGDWHVCFCVFDIIYLNGEVLTNLPLSQRLEKLKTVINPQEGRVMFSAKTQVESKEDVVKVLNEAIDNREEGVVLKDPDSVYRPASRKAGWIKVKPEYVDSLVPELDLLIIGAYFGKGRHQGVLSHFLLGVAVPSEEPGGKPREFHSVCRIGSGYTQTELGELLDKLSPHKVSHQPRSVVVSREKPEVWINPVKSFIVQVRAAEIVKSDMYQTGVTLRFPRVEKVRYDKPWYDTITTKELDQLVQEASGKLATKHYIEASNEPSAKRKTPSKAEHPSLPLHFRPADLSKVVKKDEIFSGLEMCVMGNGEDHTKQELETLVVEHGGSFTQHPGQNTHCIITDTISVRVKNYIHSSKHNIVRPSWVINCTRSGRLLPWGPLDAIHLRDKEQEYMRDLFDEFGDSYTEPTDEKSLKRIMDGMKKESWNPLSVEEMCVLDEKICDPGDTRGLFRRIKAYFMSGVTGLHLHEVKLQVKITFGEAVSLSVDITESIKGVHLSLLLKVAQPCTAGTPGREVLGNTRKRVQGEEQQLAALNLRLYGGSVCDSISSATHIVTGIESSQRQSKMDGRHLVTTEWIYSCIKSGKNLEERYYMPKIIV